MFLTVTDGSPRFWHRINVRQIGFHPNKILSDYLKRLSRVLFNVCECASVMFFFLKIFMFSLLKVAKSHQKAMSKVQAIIKTTFVRKLRLYEVRLSPIIIWLCLWFSSMKSLKIFTICEIFLAGHLKAEK